MDKSSKAFIIANLLAFWRHYLYIKEIRFISIKSNLIYFPLWRIKEEFEALFSEEIHIHHKIIPSWNLIKRNLYYFNRKELQSNLWLHALFFFAKRGYCIRYLNLHICYVWLSFESNIYLVFEYLVELNALFKLEIGWFISPKTISHIVSEWLKRQ